MEYLSSLGHQLLARNYLSPDRRTEIDLITIHEGVIHFVEVKAWRAGVVHPLETQKPFRAHKVRRAARMFLSMKCERSSGNERITELCHQREERAVSFDLLWVRDDGFEYFERIF